MVENIIQSLPSSYRDIEAATLASGFTMPSDIMTCSLLRTLAASKPSGNFLELGTGTGLATSWILDGMDLSSSVISIDNDKKLLEIASSFLGGDKRLQLIETDGEEWVMNNRNARFDYIFADTWHGKYLLLNEVLEMVKPGGFYIIDDMIPQSNWPEGHQKKATNLLTYLDQRPDFFITKQNWASGIVVASKVFR
jgi:predicted O-methyltransferase YrrM